MILSHKYKFIFIEVPKTGSTSLRSTLVEYCNSQRTTSQPPMKYVNKVDIDCNVDDFFGGNPRITEWHSHISSHELLNLVKSEITEDIWDQYFKFAFVRNPWDREVSRYNFYKNGRIAKQITAEEDVPQHVKMIHTDANTMSFAEWRGKYPISTQLDMLVDEGGVLLVDFVGRFENFQEDFDNICNEIGIPRQELSHKNKSTHAHYSEYYDTPTRRDVTCRHKDDIKTFGYEFEE